MMLAQLLRNLLMLRSGGMCVHCCREGEGPLHAWQPEHTWETAHVGN